MIAADTLYTAVTIYHEARSEPQQCQILVAEVVRNRMNKDGKSAGEVIKARGQFSWNRLLKNKSINTEYKRVSMKAKNEDKKALDNAIILAQKVMSPEYKPKTGVDSFHDRSVHVKHGPSVKCGKLVFYKQKVVKHA